jgi:predicted secreted hydrolase
VTVSDTQRQESADQASAPPPEWQRDPFQLVPGDQEFVFPAAEGAHPHCQSDTWYLAGELTAGTSGRKFAFLTIFNMNRPGGSVVADFYTMALFDLDKGCYGTYTDYDMPPKNMHPDAVPKLTAAIGLLDISYGGAAGVAQWTTRHDADGRPFTYQLDLVGTDQSGAAMRLQLDVRPTRGPVPVGADIYRGRIPHGGQAETFSYFQTGMAMTGKLSWGDVDEEVVGTSGHIDRQWFPLPAGGGGTGGDLRASSHEWWTIHLDNGVDFVGWQQFDRRKGNALQPFSGATITYEDPHAAPRCVEDLEVDTTSYVRWPETVRQLMRAPAAGRYLPDVHTVSSNSLDMELTATPLVAIPAHALPIEYMEGPAYFEGSMGGRPVRGFGFWERSLALYRDWELVDVLATTISAHRPDADGLTPAVAAMAKLIAEGKPRKALDHLEAVRPMLGRLPEESAVDIGRVIDDLSAALAAPGA